MKRIYAVVLVLAMLFACTACGGRTQGETTQDAGIQTTAATSESTTAAAPETQSETTSAEASSTSAETQEETASSEETEPVTPQAKNGDVYILYTSDIHCGINKGFGLAGLKQIRDTLEAQGYTTLLVDDGDAIQGEPIGTVSEGQAMIDLMNEIGYDVAIPGNHEFDYGADRFLELSKSANYPYISCNITYQGERIFDPYVIKEAAGLKIAFVGITTPKTIGSSSPSHFQNETGEYVYAFMQDKTGEAVYSAVQSAVDSARAEGADLVYVMAHCGLEDDCRPWTYVDIIEHTRGIDVFFDGHSHDTEQVVMKNMDGENVTRSACGTKLQAIGYSHISKEGKVLDTGIWSWTNKISAPELLGIENPVGTKVNEALDALKAQLGGVIGHTPYTLTINDPKEVDASGMPIRMVRRAETNLGDLCADAFRIQGQADIGVTNGGGVRVDIEKGDITYGDVLSVSPFGNMLCVIEVTGQQVLDALEWGMRSVPHENGSFLQVSGISFEVDASIESGCIADEYDMCIGIEGERRVKNVLVGGEPIDPEKTYTLAGHDYMLLQIADGYTMFKDAPLLQDKVEIDNQVLIDYIRDTLGGEISKEYADPYGQGRIVILNGDN